MRASTGLLFRGRSGLVSAVLITAVVSGSATVASPTAAQAAIDLPPNTAPTAVGDAYATPFGTAWTVPAPGVLGNDTDLEGDALTARVATGPSRGSLTLNTNGSFTYTPEAGFSGPVSFTYRADDQALSSDPATVNLTVAANQAPVADDDSYVTPFGTTLDVAAPGVLDGDIDPEGRPLDAEVVSGPAKGTLSLALDGSFTYVPLPGATGVDSFTYAAGDTFAVSATATVTITIGTVTNQPPTAVPDSYVTSPRTVLTAIAPGLLGNDTDPEGDALTATVGTGPAHGTLSLGPDGSFVYAPTGGYSGPDSFTYRTFDGTLPSDPAMVSITVLPDSTSPTVSLDAPVGPLSGPFPVSVRFSETVTGLAVEDFDVSGATLELAGGGADYQLVVTPIASGTVTLALPPGAAFDEAANGNTASNILARVADIDPPTVVLSSSEGPFREALRITATFAEPVTGLDLTDVAVTNGTASALIGSGTSYTFTVTPLTDGPVTVGVLAGAAVDAAGNGSTASAALIRVHDGTAPTLSIARRPGQSDPARGDEVVFEVTASEPVDALAADGLVVGGASGADAASVRRAGPTTFVVTVTGMTAGGDVMLSTVAGAVRDAAGNASVPAVPSTIAWTTTAPPVLGILADGRCVSGGDVGAISLSLTSAGPTTVVATSSNPAVVAAPRVITDGDGVPSRVSLRARAGRSGTALVTVVASNIAGTDRRTVRVVVGTGGTDRLVGGAGTDVVLARGGDDVVRGTPGRDLVCGGTGADRLHGGSGRDAVFGQAGGDVLYGGGGGDRLVGGPGLDITRGGAGRDDVDPRALTS